MSDCKEKFDLFCYICGKVCIPRSENWTTNLRNAYTRYFNQPVMENVSFAPKKTCGTCFVYLISWWHRRRTQMPFGVPMIWTDPGPIHDTSNCYVCANDCTGQNRVKKKQMVYVGVASAQRPLPHSDDVPVPQRTPEITSTIHSEPGIPSEMFSEYEPEPSESHRPVLISQDGIEQIAAELNLAKREAELLASFLKGKNLLETGVKVTAFRKRDKPFKRFFTLNNTNSYVFCNDIVGLMQTIGINYNADDWRLFLDSSKTSLKAVILHKTNEMPPVPIAYSTEMKENYETLKQILLDIKYEEHQWRISGDLKVVAILMGLQLGYTKYMCFMCLWDTRFKGNQYQTHDWVDRAAAPNERGNVIHPSLVEKEKILLPPLHIKLGMVKNFIKAIVGRPDVFECLRTIFPRLSIAKIKQGTISVASTSYSKFFVKC